MILDKEILSQLYLDKKHSMHEIAVKLNVSLNNVYYWMSRHRIKRRSRSAANYIKYNPLGNPYQIKKRLTRSDRDLYYLALGLYWGEGGKTTHHSVRLTNSDPNLAKIFVKFLIDFCQYDKHKIRYHIQTFKDQPLQSTIRYWQKALNIPSSQITTSKPLPPLGKGNYRKISKHGTITIGIYNIVFHEWIMEQLRKLGYNSTE